ncbi:MAG: hypothetical protein PHU70_03425 [Dehalococcoidia bacterium]|nr:hypothetical protein [Dehalococcoidia bacterium]MDD5647812.1 hypothetical protein [Dehalococcoidia bacterium]
MRIEYQKFIRREDLKANRDKIYLFGDNTIHVGYGGQAGEMRDEPNAVGIPTLKEPGVFFTDDEFEINKQVIDEAFRLIPSGKTVVIPSDGLGTGIARLDRVAPGTFKYLVEKIKSLENE